MFTAAEQDFADEVIDVLDTNGYISHRVYNVTNLVAGKLGRDLSKTVVVNKMDLQGYGLKKLVTKLVANM